eukprot:GFYU01006007.1.p1 GENE.GFYU01006007.1~~GFYU01006007.1.p1  ORF type:complete len:406 (-),score=144.66 GFYU01006007.1:561-1778(-)
MQFTPQQLSGYKGYGTGVRIGNWSEDWSLQDTRIQQFQLRKTRGLLHSTAAEEKLAHDLQPVHLTPLHGDQALRFGDSVMVYNVATEGVLATDLDDRQKSEEELYAVTTTPTLNPCARTVFKIARVAGQEETEQLLYGQKFALVTTDHLTKEPAYLHSCRVSIHSYAKYSRKQEVSISTQNNWCCQWEILTVDPNIRFEVEGTPVPANTPIIVNHVATNCHLGSDKIRYANDFGNEFEAHTHTYTDIGKAQMGKRNRHPVGPQNHFIFVTAPPDSHTAGEAQLPTVQAEQETASIEQVLKALSLKIGDQWANIKDAFRFVDENKNMKISRPEFKFILTKFNLHLTEKQLDVLFNSYDNDGSGEIDYDEFLEAFATYIQAPDEGISGQLHASAGGKDFTTDLSQFK